MTFTMAPTDPVIGFSSLATGVLEDRAEYHNSSSRIKGSVVIDHLRRFLLLPELSHRFISIRQFITDNFRTRMSGIRKS